VKSGVVAIRMEEREEGERYGRGCSG